MPRDPWNVAIVTYDGLCTFEFGCMAELFGTPRPEFDAWYTLKVCSVTRGPNKAAGGVEFTAPYTLRVLDRAGTIIIPGWRRPLTEVPPELLQKLRRAHTDGARLLSVCSGAFVLAAAGVLDGLRATTHWAFADELAAAYPTLTLDPDVLYVDEGNVLTSAGSAAGLDLGLHLIRRDCGAGVANAVARRLVIPPHRDGGQQQFIDVPIDVPSDDAKLNALLDDVRRDLTRRHTVESLARRMHMSSRTFARRFKAVTGTTPHRWLNHERVRHAQMILESGSTDIDTVARLAGFADAQLLRLHFKRIVGTSPKAYCKSFRGDHAKQGRNSPGSDRMPGTRG